MGVKFVIPPAPPPDPMEMYRRHEGPYTVLVHYDFNGLDVTKWQRMLYTRGEDVHEACVNWFDQRGVVSVSVFSEATKYFVTTYQRRDVDGYRARREERNEETGPRPKNRKTVFVIKRKQ